MLPFLHHLERHGLLKVAVRPFAPYLQSILTQNAHQAHKLTFISAQPIRFWSPKTPGVSRSESTFLPRGAWDSHVHVVDEEAFPFALRHTFRPKKASLQDLLKFEEQLGIDHVCLTAISVYGTDNSLLLQSLRQLNRKGRAVVSIDPDTISDSDLEEMHELGVRAIRIILNPNPAVERRDRKKYQRRKKKLVAKLWSYAERIRRLKWSIELHIGLAGINKIAGEIPKLGVPVVIDHLARPRKNIVPRLQPGYTQLINLLAKKQIWVKLSGTYRFSELPEMDSYAREILRIAPTQVVWASDWPHTGGVVANPRGDRLALQEYRKINVPAFIAQCREWCNNDEALIQKIFVDNPRRLWQYEDND